MTAAIEVAHVSKSFRRHRPDRPMMLQEVLARGISGLRTTEQFWALRDVSFSVEPGSAVGIIGTNGSGKSTLLRLIGGIGSVDSGTVRVTGRVGALLDLGSGIHPDLTGRENVIVAGVLSGLSRREVLRRFDDIVAFSEIGKFIDNPMRTYSSGMQMRLAFAINVHTDPDVLLIDEVLAVGDAAFQRKCLDRIKQFKANGCSILLVSHGLGVVQQLCDEVLWMHYGQLMAQGPVREVVRQYEGHVGHCMEPVLVGEEDAALEAPLKCNTSPAVAAPVGSSRPSSIVAITLLDDAGRALAELRAGQPLRVVIDFATVEPVVAPHFRVRIVREDGLVCCDLVSERVETPPESSSAGGRMTLHLDRLDLNTGHYAVDVVVWGAQGPQESPVGQLLAVRGDAIRQAVLTVPHRWELAGTTTAAPTRNRD